MAADGSYITFIPYYASVKINTLPSGSPTYHHGEAVEIDLGNGEKAVYSRDSWQKLAAKGWWMDDAFVHIPWRCVPEALPLGSRLWLYFWMQRSLQTNEDVTIRHAMLRQWGFPESAETIRKALHRMQAAGLLQVIGNGKKQLRILLAEPRPPSTQRTKTGGDGAALHALNSATEEEIRL